MERGGFPLQKQLSIELVKYRNWNANTGCLTLQPRFYFSNVFPQSKPMCLMRFNIRVTKSFTELREGLGTLVRIAGIDYIK